MPTQTLRPDSTVQSPSLVIVDTTAHGATSDDSDSTYVHDMGEDTSTDRTVLGLADPSPALPTGSLIKACRIRIRASGTDSSGKDIRTRQKLGSSVTSADAFNPGTAQGTWADADGAWRDEKPGGGEWTHSDVANAQLTLAQVQTDNFWVAELYFDVDYNEKPVVTVTAPTGTITDTTRPTIEWSYSDPEGDPLEAAEFRVYEEPGGGWTAESPGGGGTIVYDSGEVLLDSADDHTLTDDLVNGTYRAYVRARQQWSGSSDHWSDWALSDFTVSVSPPAVPTLTLVAQPDNARVSVTVTDPATGEVPDTVEVQHSDDAGATWLAMRNAVDAAIASGGSVEIHDYEAPFNAERQYRARAKRVVGGLTISSAWSSSSGATITTTRRWLTDPRDPDSLNMKIAQFDHARGWTPPREVVHQPAGMDISVVETETPRRGDRISVRLTGSTAAQDFIDKAILEPRNLLLRDHREAVYVRLTGARGVAQRSHDNLNADEFEGTMVKVARPEVTS